MKAFHQQIIIKHIHVPGAIASQAHIGGSDMAPDIEELSFSRGK